MMHLRIARAKAAAAAAAASSSAAGAPPAQRPPSLSSDGGSDDDGGGCLSDGEGDRPQSFMLSRVMSDPPDPAVVARSSFGPAVFPSAAWWSRSIRNILAVKWDHLHLHGRSAMVRIEEGCAGMGSATLAARSLEVPLRSDTVMSDKKAAAQQFLLATAPADTHMSLTIFALMRQVLVFATGMDVIAQPYTVYSVYRQTSPSAHSGYSATFGNGEANTGNVVDLVVARQPRALVVENVTAFGTNPDPKTQKVPLVSLIEQLRTINRGDTNEALFKAYHVFEMSPRKFVKMSRPRTAAVLLFARVLSPSVLHRWFEGPGLIQKGHICERTCIHTCMRLCKHDPLHPFPSGCPPPMGIALA
jgi:hypothetical protein